MAAKAKDGETKTPVRKESVYGGLNKSDVRRPSDTAVTTAHLPKSGGQGQGAKGKQGGGS